MPLRVCVVSSMQIIGVMRELEAQVDMESDIYHEVCIKMDKFIHEDRWSMTRHMHFMYVY